MLNFQIIPLHSKSLAFKADSVRFYNLMIFDDKPILGSFENKLVESNRNSKFNLS